MRSKELSVQARYWPDDNAKRGTARAFAVTGAVLGDHILQIESTTMGNVTWDGQPILQGLPSKFEALVGLISANYSDSGKLIDPELYHLPLRVMEVQLFPGIRLLFNRWPIHVDALITMRPEFEDLDGLCGNGNGDPSDDTVDMIMLRRVEVLAGESLFVV